MHREYDVFEKFADGSSLWRASVLGSAGARLYMLELTQKSGNRFYAIEMASGKIIHLNAKRVGMDFLASPKLGRRSRSAAA